jgi:hypothetical protein
MQFREIIGKEYVTWVMEDELPVQLKEAEWRLYYSILAARRIL